MLLGITRMNIQTRELKFLPQLPILKHEQRVSFRQDEKLRSDSELLERYLRQHHVLATRGVPLGEVRISREDLDEALVLGLRREGVQYSDRVPEEGAVDESERVEGNARLGDECEVQIQWIVEDGVGHEPTRGGDECGRRALGSLGRYEPVLEELVSVRELGGGIGVDVDVVEAFVAGEELGPDGGEDEIGVCEEEEGNFGPSV